MTTKLSRILRQASITLGVTLLYMLVLYYLWPEPHYKAVLILHSSAWLLSVGAFLLVMRFPTLDIAISRGRLSVAGGVLLFIFLAAMIGLCTV
jgi:hypothetical protein